MFEHLQQLVCAVVPFRAIFAQRLADNPLKLRQSLLVITRERRWLHLKNRRHHFSWCVAGEWRMPRYHFVKDYAQTPDIRGFINRHAARLFR